VSNKKGFSKIQPLSELKGIKGSKNRKVISCSDFWKVVKNDKNIKFDKFVKSFPSRYTKSVCILKL